MQPVDLALCAGLFCFFLNRQLVGLQIMPRSSVYGGASILLLYAVMRLGFGYLHTSDPVELYGIVQNTYNMILLMVFTSVLLHLVFTHSFNDFYHIMLKCLLITTVLPVCTFVMNYPNSFAYRATLTFNNPNQLGFFALVNLSLFFYVTLLAHENNHAKIKILSSFFILNVNVAFLFLSASRAAAPAILLYVFSCPLLLQFQLSKGMKWIFWSGVCAWIIGLISKELFYYMVIVRKSMLYTTQTGMMEDIYIRAIAGISYNLTHLFYFIFGYGAENNPWRINNLEFHNNFTFVFNQLGCIGLVLYCYVIFKIGFELLKKGFLYILPFLCYFFYSDFQYALRTRMNWLLFAVYIFIILYKKKDREIYDSKSPVSLHG